MNLKAHIVLNLIKQIYLKIIAMIYKIASYVSYKLTVLGLGVFVLHKIIITIKKLKKLRITFQNRKMYLKKKYQLNINKIMTNMQIYKFATFQVTVPKKIK